MAACKGGVAEVEAVQSGASAAADMMRGAPDEGGREGKKKKKAFTSCAGERHGGECKVAESKPLSPIDSTY